MRSSNSINCTGLKCYNKNNDTKNDEICENDYLEICENFDLYPTIISHKERIIAIGDIHGDMNLAINFLKSANLIEEVFINYEDNEIIEYIYELEISGSKIKLLEKTKKKYVNFSKAKNQVEIVYRYYKINNEYLVKIVQDDNNPNHKINPNDNNRWFRWIGANTYVVQVGDQIDRCRPFDGNECSAKDTTINDEDSDLEIMLFYDSLNKIARFNNGRVFSLLGNHEIMNIMGDMRYVSYKGMSEYSPEPKDVEKGRDVRISKFKETISKKMACTRSTILVIGDYLFVHGGIAQKMAVKYKLIDINSIIRHFLSGSVKKSKDLKLILNSSKISPLWYRRLAYIPPDINNNQHHDCKKILEPVFDQINQTNSEISSEPIIQLKGMIIGHTPQFTVFNQGITTACDNRIIRVDIGASMAFDVFANSLTKIEKEKMKEARLPQVIEITRDRNNISTVKILKFTH
jgi:hypothetical protein